VSETRSRIVTPPATTDALSSMIGRSLLSARIISPGPQLADAAHAPGGGVDEDDDDNQHEAEAHGERQVALRGLERRRGGHHAGEAVDVATDDHHGADLRGGAAETGEQRGDQ